MPITHPNSEEWRHAQPYFLPDGQHFAYQTLSARTNDVDIVLATLDGVKKGVLLKNVSRDSTSFPTARASS